MARGLEPTPLSRGRIAPSGIKAIRCFPSELVPQPFLVLIGIDEAFDLQYFVRDLLDPMLHEQGDFLKKNGHRLDSQDGPPGRRQAHGQTELQGFPLDHHRGSFQDFRPSGLYLQQPALPASALSFQLGANGLLHLPSHIVAKGHPTDRVFPEVGHDLPLFQGIKDPEPGRRGKRIGLDPVDDQLILREQVFPLNVLVGLVAFFVDSEQCPLQIIGRFHIQTSSD